MHSGIDILGVFMSGLSATLKIFFISIAGYFGAIYPKDSPIFTTTVLRALSRISNHIFLPALLFTSIARGFSLQAAGSLTLLVVLCLWHIGVSYGLAFTVGKWIIGSHPVSQEFVTILMVMIGSPNCLSVPILVMRSACEQSLVFSNYGTEDKCKDEAMSLVSAYNIGFNLTFWTFGFKMMRIFSERQAKAAAATESAVVTETANILSTASNSVNADIDGAEPPLLLQSSVSRYLIRMMDNLPLLATILGIAVGLVPPLQRLLFSEDTPVLCSLAEALETIGEPLVCVNCLVMAAYLGHVNLFPDKMMTRSGLGNSRGFERLRNDGDAEDAEVELSATAVPAARDDNSTSVSDSGSTVESLPG